MVFEGPTFNVRRGPLHLVLVLSDELNVWPAFPICVPCQIAIGRKPPARDLHHSLGGAEHLLHDYRCWAVTVFRGRVVVEVSGPFFLEGVRGAWAGGVLHGWSSYSV